LGGRDLATLTKFRPSTLSELTLSELTLSELTLSELTLSELTLSELTLSGRLLATFAQGPVASSLLAPVPHSCADMSTLT